MKSKESIIRTRFRVLIESMRPSGSFLYSKFIPVLGVYGLIANCETGWMIVFENSRHAVYTVQKKGSSKSPELPFFGTKLSIFWHCVNFFWYIITEIDSIMTSGTFFK